MEKQKKSGFIALVGRPNVGKIHVDESSDWTKDCDHIKKASDNENQIRTSIQMSAVRPFSGYAGHP